MRRARAIATAPRRKRYDDDDDAEIDEKRSRTFCCLVWFAEAHWSLSITIGLLGLIESSPVLIPTQLDIQQTQSLPQTRSGIDLIPTFRIDPPDRELSEPTSCTDCHRLFRNRYSSAPLPSLHSRRYWLAKMLWDTTWSWTWNGSSCTFVTTIVSYFSRDKQIQMTESRNSDVKAPGRILFLVFHGREVSYLWQWFDTWVTN